VLIAATSKYPAAFGLYERQPGASSAATLDGDPMLQVRIREYIEASTQLLQHIEQSLRATVGSGPIVVWGAGQLAMKLLAGVLRDVPVDAIVDSAQDKWGERFGDIPVIAPHDLNSMVDEQVPIVVTSIHHQDSITATIHSQFPTRSVVTIAAA
jgi:hypothetical protein